MDGRPGLDEAPMTAIRRDAWRASAIAPSSAVGTGPRPSSRSRNADRPFPPVRVLGQWRAFLVVRLADRGRGDAPAHHAGEDDDREDVWRAAKKLLYRLG